MSLCYFESEASAAPRFGWTDGEQVIALEDVGGPASLVAALQMGRAELLKALDRVMEKGGERLRLDDVRLRTPLDAQEVWAAGVTYLRSRDARMEESTQKDVYDRVYDADRPELFLKATPHRVSGPGEPIAIRADSGWDVPEPELTLLMNSRGEVVGYTIGNDVSSRSIEGENPLYLPQAKVFSHCAALGPVVVMENEIGDPSNLPIELTIRREGEVLFQDATSTRQMHRTFDELREYLFRANSFPSGVFLMTGAGIVPPLEFTLQGGDEVSIAIAGIGTLVNPVLRLP